MLPDKKLTVELLTVLPCAEHRWLYIREHDFAAPSLSVLPEAASLQEKGFKRSRVVRMADRLNETFGYRDLYRCASPSRNKVLQIAFAMALTLKEANRALTAARVSVLNCKDRRVMRLSSLHDRGCSPKGQRGSCIALARRR